MKQKCKYMPDNPKTWNGCLVDTNSKVHLANMKHGLTNGENVQSSHGTTPLDKDFS